MNVTNILSSLGLTNLNIKLALPTSALVLLALHFYRSQSRPRTTRLRGPASKSFVFGVSEDILASHDLGELFRNWEKAHGPVYEIPSGLGSKMVVFGDPKAIAHVLAKDTTTYHQRRLIKILLKDLVNSFRTDKSGETNCVFFTSLGIC